MPAWLLAPADWCLHAVAPRVASVSRSDTSSPVVTPSSKRRRSSRAKSQPFNRARRLTHKREFDRVYQTAPRRFSNKHFTVLVLPNDISHARIGLSIAARAVGRAVDRNRIKRIIRESFRLRHDKLPAVDIVVNARAGVASADNEALRTSLEHQWNLVITQCARS